MKPRCFFSPMKSTVGFTLIEMIGVLAILTIMAAVLTPNVLHSIERAVVRTEADNLHTLGQEIGYYLRDNSVGATPSWPTSPGYQLGTGWSSQLASYSSLNATDIQINRRGMYRLYVADTTNHRALLISSMRNGVALPLPSQITANFQGIWDTADGNVPPGAGWGSWTAGAGGNIEYLVIERVSLSAVFQTDLQSFDMLMNNNLPGATTRSYKIVPAVGSPSAVKQILGGAVMTEPLRPRDRLYLYSDLGGTALNFVYVVSNSSKSFVFTTYWAPQ